MAKAKKTATTAIEKTVEAAPAKKTAPKKTAPKKVAPKKPEAVAKAVAEKAEMTEAKTVVETKVNFFIEYGNTQVAVDEIVKNVKATYGKDAKEISIYLKPDSSKAYFVADGEEGQMDVYFC
ncbi:MAG: DUF6465 family protein [Ruminococcus sp.]|nr:DUF6465 family protein [Ruminococcus sp.]